MGRGTGAAQHLPLMILIIMISLPYTALREAGGYSLTLFWLISTTATIVLSILNLSLRIEREDKAERGSGR